MTRELKLALLVGFGLNLLIAIIIADHLSPAHRDDMGTIDEGAASAEGEDLAGPDLPRPGGPRVAASRGTGEGRDANPDSERSLIHRLRPPTPAAAARRDEGGAGTDAASATDAATAPPPIEMGRPADPPEPSAPAGRVVASGIVHEVRKGESFWSIARRYYGDPTLHGALAAHNEAILAGRPGLEVGMMLEIPDRERLEGRDRAIESPSERRRGGEERRHVIARSDTLSELAARYLGSATRWPDILDRNSEIIEDPDRLPVGLEIVIPAR